MDSRYKQHFRKSKTKSLVEVIGGITNTHNGEQKHTTTVGT